VWNLLTSSEISINFGIKRAAITFFTVHIKDGVGASTINTAFAIKKGKR
jgi:hypothetical protein